MNKVHLLWVAGLGLMGCSSDSSDAGGGGQTASSATTGAGPTQSSATSAVSSSASTTGGGGGDSCAEAPLPGPASAADCQGYCELLANAACPNDPSVADCTASCVEEVSFYSSRCESETVGLLDCYKASAAVSCDGAGLSLLSGCESATLDFQICTACVVLPTDSACQCCEATSCCAAVSAFLASEDASSYVACRQACGPSPSCWEGCAAQYPAAGAAFDDYNLCINGACGEACFG